MKVPHYFKINWINPEARTEVSKVFNADDVVWTGRLYFLLPNDTLQISIKVFVLMESG